jgi:hypothetical protein
MAPENCKKCASKGPKLVRVSRSTGLESFWSKMRVSPSSTISPESPRGPSVGATRDPMITRSPSNSTGSKLSVLMKLVKPSPRRARSMKPSGKSGKRTVAFLETCSLRNCASKWSRCKCER